MAKSNIHVVMVAVPGYGHVRPMRSLTRHLTQLGYPVTFITAHPFRKSFEAIPGVEFVQLQGKADFDQSNVDELWPERTTLPKDQTRFLYDLKHIFYSTLPDQHETLHSVLSRPELAEKKVVLLADLTYVGVLPMVLGSPTIRRVPIIGIGHAGLGMLSKDTAPFGMGLPSQGEEKNTELNAQMTQMMSGVQDYLKEILEPYQCAKKLPSDNPLDLWFRIHELFLQLGVPAMEPYRSDLPSSVRFVGMLLGANDKKPLPEWFDAFIVDDKSDRPLIMVTSGTLPNMDPHELIIPTIEACSSLPVRLLVCAVNASRPADLTLPDNARWAKWIPFEELFEYTSIVVSNGGFGGVSQAFAAGIPMVISGLTEDKAETGARAEATGAAINLMSQSPGVEQVRGAIQKILSDGKYKERAMELKKAYAEYDAPGSCVQAVNEMAEQFYGKANGHMNGHA